MIQGLFDHVPPPPPLIAYRDKAVCPEFEFDTSYQPTQHAEEQNKFINEIGGIPKIRYSSP